MQNTRLDAKVPSLLERITTTSGMQNDTALTAKSEKELKSLLMRPKE